MSDETQAGTSGGEEHSTNAAERGEPGPTGKLGPGRAPWQRTLYEIIFDADSAGGKAFDVVLIAAITISVAVVLLDSMKPIHQEHAGRLLAAEWIFTGLFTVEYLLRLACVDRPRRYATSFFGVVDLLAVVPTYVSLFVPGSQALIVIRILRALRIFRVLKLGHHVREANMLGRALWASRRKVLVFLYAVLTLVVIIGSLMYLIEGEEHGFTSIPRSIYWTVVTLTTVGFGDITPGTPLGQALSVVVMLLGFAIIAVPTGIVTVELAQAAREWTHVKESRCGGCGAIGHDGDARHCKHCGAAL